MSRRLSDEVVLVAVECGGKLEDSESSAPALTVSVPES